MDINNLMHIAARVAAGIIFIYLIYCASFFVLQRPILFPGTRLVIPAGTIARPANVEQIWLDTRAGPVEAWFLPPDRAAGGAGAAPVMIVAHGNGEVIDFLPEEFAAFTRLGVGVLLVEYPGYGRSAGTPSQSSITEVFVTAYDEIVARPSIDSTRVVLFGRSLGGGAVCALAAKRPSVAMILVSTFTSVRSFANHYYAPGFLVRDPFDNLECVRSYTGPVLIIHGRRDTLIPYDHGVTLHGAARQGTLVTYDCGHNDCPPDPAAFQQDVAGFLREAGVLPR